MPLVSKALHKQEIGYVAVAFDIASILIMIHMFSRLRSISSEYTSLIRQHQITMSDFAVMCANVQLDKYTQDARLIKMRVWLHFTKLLRLADEIKYAKYAENKQYMAELKEIRGEDSEVVDVTLSLATQPKYVQIFSMEQTQNQINTIKSKLQAGEYQNAEYFQKQEELEDLSE